MNRTPWPANSNQACKRARGSGETIPNQKCEDPASSPLCSSPAHRCAQPTPILFWTHLMVLLRLLRVALGGLRRGTGCARLAVLQDRSVSPQGSDSKCRLERFCAAHLAAPTYGSSSVGGPDSVESDGFIRRKPGH